MTTITAIAGTEGVNDVDAGLLLVDDLVPVERLEHRPVQPRGAQCGCDRDRRGQSTARTRPPGRHDREHRHRRRRRRHPDGGRARPHGVLQRVHVRPRHPHQRQDQRGVRHGRQRLPPVRQPVCHRSGISILGGDHELYVPDRDIGRLVETTDEIRLQLDNFSTSAATRPRHFQPPAAVTGYDFLNDGAEAASSIGSGIDVDPNSPGIDAERPGRSAVGQDGVPRTLHSS